MTRHRRRLLTVGHSYVISLNRELARQLASRGARDWEVLSAAPRRFSADLGPVMLERTAKPESIYELDAHWSQWSHGFWYGRSLRKLLRARWDLVHCWEEPYVLAAAQVAHWTPPSVPLVLVTAQNLNKRYPQPFRQFERRNMHRASGLIALGETVRNTVSLRDPYSKTDLRVIPLGVDVDVFRPEIPAGHALRRSLGWPSFGPPVVGFLGRFVPEKGLPLLQDALSKLVTPWRALFVGGGPLEGQLRVWASKYGDQVRVITGVRHLDVPRYLNAMDLLCAPSQTTVRWREQFGRMLIEAFACGVAVIGSDSGEIPYTLGAAGEIRPEHSVDSWVEGISVLLESTERRRLLAASGRERAVESFAWPVVAHRHLEFFKEVLSKKSA